MLGILVAIAISSQAVGDCGCHQQQPSYPAYSQPSYTPYPQPSYWSPDVIISDCDECDDQGFEYVDESIDPCCDGCVESPCGCCDLP